jgi:hypothetical protein
VFTSNITLSWRWSMQPQWMRRIQSVNARPHFTMQEINGNKVWWSTVFKAVPVRIGSILAMGSDWLVPAKATNNFRICLCFLRIQGKLHKLNGGEIWPERVSNWTLMQISVCLAHRPPIASQQLQRNSNYLKLGCAASWNECFPCPEV